MTKSAVKKRKGCTLWLVCGIGILAVTGVLFGWMHSTSPRRVVNLAAFQKQMERKEKLAFETLTALRDRMQREPVDSLVNFRFPDDDISYYVLENGELQFWSDNRLDISSVDLRAFKDWHYVQLPNACCVILSCEDGERVYAALLIVKYDYPYENGLLSNRFARGFDMDKHVGVAIGDATDDYPVFCSEGHYLFSLVKPTKPVYNELWSRLACVSYALCLLLMFAVYAGFPRRTAKGKLSLRAFLLSTVAMGSLVLVMLWFDIPSALFGNELFAPSLYSCNRLFDTICHLSVFTFFVLSTSCLLYFHVDMQRMSERAAMALQLLYPIGFTLLYAGLNSLVFHSSIDMGVLGSDELQWAGLWALFLVMLWGVALVLVFYVARSRLADVHQWRKALFVDFLLLLLLFARMITVDRERLVFVLLSYVCITVGLYLYYCGRKKYRRLLFLCWPGLYAAFVVLCLWKFGEEKNREKYRVLAQNMSVSGNVESDRMADLLLEELDGRMVSDERIASMVEWPDSLKDYLAERYFHGFWNKYDIQLVVDEASSGLSEEYMEYIDQSAVRIGRTRFYRVPGMQNAMTHIGVFDGTTAWGDSLQCFVELYPRRQYRSYSFLDLLIPASADIYRQLELSVCKYDGHSLSYASGAVDYPQEDDWITDLTMPEGYAAVHAGGYVHHVYAQEDGSIVVTKRARHGLSEQIRFFIYLYVAYLILAWLLLRAARHMSGADDFRFGLAARFQYMLIALLVLCFSGVFYFSIDFIKKRYHEEQIENLKSKRNYIQGALQSMYYWNQSLDESNTSALNLDLQELSYIYQTDIHVYDNNGVLVGSSQPLLFYRHLISDRMAPRPYFSTNPNMEQYEQVGELDYLAAYTDFYNGDYLQIGYIAVPQFLSEENMRAEIKNFTSVIIHIYLAIALLGILLSVLVGRRLTAPLNVLERKLKEMRIGSRNEKIDYRYNDEIGQLVAQYNRTVDELEQSVRLLAQSERESAWKSMARQIAHEINNPLTPMKLSIQQLQRRMEIGGEGFNEYFKHTASMLVEQIDNLSRIAGTFSSFARMPEAKPTQVNLSAVLQSVVQLFANNKEQVAVSYSEPDEPIHVIADADQLIQVFNNLIKNAIQAIPPERLGRVVVSSNSDGERAVVTVADNGNGVPDEVKDKMFMPNFTTKARGMGLGLAISKKIVEQSGGTITFETREDEGSVFKVELPAV